MAGLKAVNPGDIVQAIEDQIVLKQICVRENIKWLLEGKEPTDKPTGIRDILLVINTDVSDDPKQIGGGRLGTRMELFVDVRLRTELILDPTATSKDWIKDHLAQRDTVIDAIIRLFPTDTGLDSGNALTVYGLRLDRNAVPRLDRTPKWGESVCQVRCEYLPKIRNVPIG